MTTESNTMGSREVAKAETRESRDVAKHRRDTILVSKYRSDKVQKRRSREDSRWEVEKHTGRQETQWKVKLCLSQHFFDKMKPHPFKKKTKTNEKKNKEKERKKERREKN